MLTWAYPARAASVTKVRIAGVTAATLALSTATLAIVMSVSRWLLCVALVATGLSAVAQVSPWKWRDKNGQVHISDMPPPREVADKDILQRPAAARSYALPPAAASAANAAVAAASAPKVDPELEARRKAAESEKDAKKKADEAAQAAARAENCKSAQGYMRTLDDGMRISRVNEKGEREVLDDQQRAAEVQRTKQAIESNCR
jgi:hypothetical protein